MVGRLRLYKKRVALVATGITLSFGLSIIPAASAVTIGGPSDCDNNAIIKCGAHSTSALISAYNSSAYVQKVYAYFGISSADMANLPSTDAVGRVTIDGRVFVGNQSQPVATDAWTGGRQDSQQNMCSSTQVNFRNVMFFKRRPCASFLQSSLPAFVSTKNGTFQFAIIASCGNAVMATPVAPPKPAPKPSVAPAKPVSKPPKPQQPAKPQAPAAPQPTQTQAQQQQQTVNQNVTQNQQVTVTNTSTSQGSEQAPAETTPAAPTTTSAETVAAAPPTSETAAAPDISSGKGLPNVGPGGTVSVFVGSTILGILGYRRYLLHILGG